MSSPALHFPSAKEITDHLSKDKNLNDEYFQEAGITTAVIKLATERFADKELQETGIKIGVQFIVLDLQRGRDGFTKKELPKIDGFDEDTWTGIAELLQTALINCAKSTASSPAETK